jgi:serine palmitoyltransferase
VAEPTQFEELDNEKRPVIVGPTGPKSKLSNGRTVTNLASYNFYNFVANETLKEKAIQTLRTYGVGPCGPPGFYGTQDVHMKAEADVAAHLGVPACIIYAQSFSTISSVIPSFLKRGDIIIADSSVNYAVRKGIQISRSTVRWYQHNDMEDLESVLKKVTKEHARKPLTRRFIITEGLFENIGDVVNLPRLVCSSRRKAAVRTLTRRRSSSSSSTSSASSSTRRGPTASSAEPAAASRNRKTSTPPKLT